MSKLKDALMALDNAVKDLTSLHVQTFTGTVDFAVDGSQSFDNISALVKEAAKSADGTEARIKLVAESLYKFDGDSYNFISADQDSIPEAALELHKAAVEGGIKTREGLMNLVKGIF